MNIGVIGFGKMGMLHAGIVNGLKGHKTVSISENSDFIGSSLKALMPHIKVYSDYVSMLDNEKLDAVFITTPVHMHVDMAIEAIRRKIPFFVEKPMALSASDSKRLVDELDKTPTLNMVGYMMRYISTFKKAKKIIASNALGDIITFNYSLYVSQLFKPGKGWRYDKTKSGGGLMMGPTSHVVDLMSWFFGPTHGVNASSLGYYSKTTEDFIHAIFHMKSGVKGWLDSSWSVRGHRLVESRFEVHGSRGMLILTDDYVKVCMDEATDNLKAGWTSWTKPELHEEVELDIGGPQYTLEDVDFLEHVKRGEKIECDVYSAHEVQKIITAIYESAEEKGAFKVVNS